MHQNMWIAAISELEAQENIVFPSTFPRELEKQEVSYAYFDLSRGEESRAGRWASGPSMDSMGQFEYVPMPPPYGKKPHLCPAPPYMHNTMLPPTGPNHHPPHFA